jgi:hypothetical protein
LGADIGGLAILHSWGQNLQLHPHIHCVIPGGGISNDRKKWIKSKNKNFFIHVKRLSKLFKGKFLYYFNNAYNEKKIYFAGKIKNYQKAYNFDYLLNKLYIKKWVVFSKKPFSNPEIVLKYLGRYTHRIAISNNRIISFKNNKVSFIWKDYKDNNKKKVMTLDVFEFTRRFLLHILPTNFVRIRSFGFLSNRSKKEKLELCNKLLNNKKNINDNIKNEAWQELLFSLTGINPTICSQCKKGKYIITETILSEKEILKRSRFDSS